MNISNGRLILGLGSGWAEPEYKAFGYPYDHRASRFEEALTIISGLIRTGEVDFHGEYYSADQCELRPRGPRPGGMPIMIGTFLGERMMSLTAKHADHWEPSGVVDRQHAGNNQTIAGQDGRGLRVDWSESSLARAKRRCAC